MELNNSHNIPYPYPLWLPFTSLFPPSGMIPPPRFATIFESTSGASVLSFPSLSSAQPSGSGFSILLYISNFPRVTTVVEQSNKNGYGSAGIATAIGLEPSIAFLPNVGTIIASEFVHAIPRSPSSLAIFA